VIKRLGLATVIVGFAFPAGASAHHVGNHFKWGYNWLGPNHGTIVASSGFAGWDDLAIHKTSGGFVFYGYIQPNDEFCSPPSMGGTDADYYTRLESGCEPYVRVFTHFESGDDSYLRFDSYR
jgi:hypothetical protein